MDAKHVINKLPAIRSRRAAYVSLIILFAVVFFVPYLFPVAHTVSVSYIVGYNNRVAFVLFAVGSIVFGLLAAKNFPEPEAADQLLGPYSLVAALVITVLSCTVRLVPIANHRVGSEGAYFLNRAQMLASGLRPYIDFEYAYGPSHLYIPVFFAHLVHCSVVRGYYAWWSLQWLLGTVMLWTAIRLIDLPVPRRRIYFWLLFLLQLCQIRDEGAVYTPIRSIGAAFFVVVVVSLWNRAHRPMATVLAALLCVSIAFAISPEQGVALFVGLLGWFILLTSQRSSSFPHWAAVLFAGGGAILTITCWRFGEFKTLLEFSSGAYAFPLLPSPANIIILISYVAAACIGVKYLLARRFNSVVVPLFLVGYALLPAALNRCDLGHLMSASPIFLLGIAAIESRPSMRSLWSPFAILLVIVPVIAMGFMLLLVDNQTKQSSTQTTTSEPDPAVLSTAPAPCPVIYRSLNVAPRPNRINRQDCLDTGYYFLTSIPITEHAIDRMIGELNRQPLEPLVLLDQPLAKQFPPREFDVGVLRILELSLWLPRPRNQPFTYNRLIEAIERNYTPNPTPVGGLRIWQPKSALSP